MFYTNICALGNNILERGVAPDGRRFKNKIAYSPTLYIPTQKDTDWKALDGRSVGSVKWGSIKETRDALRKYKDVENMEIFGQSNYVYQYISDYYPQENIDYDLSKIKVAIIDIEVASEHGFPNPENAAEEVIAISIKIDDIIRVYGCSDFITNEENVVYNQCTNEKHLLESFLSDWSDDYPDIITGWNTKTFDIPYLVNRIEQVFGSGSSRKLSPWGYVKEQKIFVAGGREAQTYEIYGISGIDYMDTYKKFTYINRESYSLNYIAYTELGEKKLDYSEYATLHTLYKEDFQRFIDYNIKDVILVDRLEQKTKLMEMVISLGYMAKCNFADVFAQTRMWDSIIYNHLLKSKIVIPQKKKSSGEPYEGAYVKEPHIGMHKWVVSFDLNSLYPHLIMQYNISPETIIDRDKLPSAVKEFASKVPDVESLLISSLDTSVLKENNLSVTPNNEYWRRDFQGFLPKLMEKMYTDRVKYKNLMLAEEKKGKNADVNKLSQYYNMQMNIKIALNSAYGALGNEWFRFYDVRLASAVSVAGQLSIRWAINTVNKFLNELLETDGTDYVIASDTDSLYIALDPLVHKVGLADASTEKIVNFLDKACETKIRKVIDKSYQELAEYVNAFQQKMVMVREVIADRGIWTAKKHYVLNVHNSEGVQYEEPKLKIMGIEAIKSSTPEPCRTALKEIFKIIMSGTEENAIEYIENFKTSFKSLPAEEVAFPRSVKGLKKYRDSATIYRKSTPIHVKGSLIHNHMLTSKKLSRKYPKIQEGEKIKFVYLKKPNPTGDIVVSMLNKLPEEFDLKEYIDYDTQFNKSFIDPLKLILNVIGWDTEKRSSLDSFFS